MRVAARFQPAASANGRQDARRARPTQLQRHGTEAIVGVQASSSSCCGGAAHTRDALASVFPVVREEFDVVDAAVA